ncbi:beta-ketoacyl-ACP synthase II [Aestuariispira insulae]|uniref:3-oxoacyl-[acyl-carrier-protein] synthase 2 n=1 Tax=Aestuariispira insulae TaxID=1461337 RepID=A0A3D9HGF0_9PROT|nr:beta-ketoacyl-ACP synthase II [Aestuariispira insulae]RED48553.1 3-oxoacyl-[acyl-carrier-protein] synthase II [Aestuariispira insulae]
MREVVVTGMGLVTPLGVGLEANWDKLSNGVSGVKKITEDWAEEILVKVAGLVRDENFRPEEIVLPKDLRKMDRFIQFAMVAAEQAVAQAGLDVKNDMAGLKAGTAIASGIGGFPAIMEAERERVKKGNWRMSPFLIPSFLANLAAGQVSIRHGLKGPLHTPVTACAAGAQAIGGAARLIATGEADTMVAGGSEACIDPISLSGFAAAKAIYTGEERPAEESSRPFDKDRAGFVMGEGAGIMVLEAREVAEARGAKILARVAGYGETADAHHMTSPPSDGEGAVRAMANALAQADMSPQQVGHLNAHSTSTSVGDAAELRAIKTVFGNWATRLGISGTKSMTGHLLGAAGAVETIFSTLALMNNFIPPTANLDQPDDEFADLDLMAKQGRRQDLEAVICNAFGFGGVNASLVLAKA